jgi:hypothetical protein
MNSSDRYLVPILALHSTIVSISHSTTLLISKVCLLLLPSLFVLLCVRSLIVIVQDINPFKTFHTVLNDPFIGTIHPPLHRLIFLIGRQPGAHHKQID